MLTMQVVAWVIGPVWMTNRPRQTDLTTGDRTGSDSLPDLVVLVAAVDSEEVLGASRELTRMLHGLVVEEEIWALQHLEEMALVGGHRVEMTMVHGPEALHARRCQIDPTGAALVRLVRMMRVHGPVGRERRSREAMAVVASTKGARPQMRKRCGHEALDSSHLRPLVVMGRSGVRSRKRTTQVRGRAKNLGKGLRPCNGTRQHQIQLTTGAAESRVPCPFAGGAGTQTRHATPLVAASQDQTSTTPSLPVRAAHVVFLVMLICEPC